MASISLVCRDLRDILRGIVARSAKGLFKGQEGRPVPDLSGCGCLFLASCRLSHWSGQEFVVLPDCRSGVGSGLFDFQTRFDVCPSDVCVICAVYHLSHCNRRPRARLANGGAQARIYLWHKSLRGPHSAACGSGSQTKPGSDPGGEAPELAVCQADKTARRSEVEGRNGESGKD